MIFTAVLAVLFVGGANAATAVGPANTNFTTLVNGKAYIRCSITNFQGQDAASWTFRVTSLAASNTIVQVTGPSGNPSFASTYNTRTTTNGTLSTGEFNIVISNITTADRGEYTCSITSGPSRAFYLSVIEPPSGGYPVITYKGSNSPGLTHVPVDSDVTVECSAALTRPLPTLKWYKGDNEIVSTSTEITSGITSTQTNSGNYYTVKSSLKTKFSKSDKNKKLTCSATYDTLTDAIRQTVTLGAGSAVASKLLLAMLALASGFLHN